MVIIHLMQPMFLIKLAEERLSAFMPSATRTTQTCQSGFPACRHVNFRGRSSQKEAERVPDNYPHRPPTLSDRREHTQSNTWHQRRRHSSAFVHSRGGLRISSMKNYPDNSRMCLVCSGTHQKKKAIYFLLHHFVRKCTQPHLKLALCDVTNGTDTPLISLLYPPRALHGDLVFFAPLSVNTEQ